MLADGRLQVESEPDAKIGVPVIKDLIFDLYISILMSSPINLNMPVPLIVISVLPIDCGVGWRLKKAMIEIELWKVLRQDDFLQGK